MHLKVLYTSSASRWRGELGHLRLSRPRRSLKGLAAETHPAGTQDAPSWLSPMSLFRLSLLNSWWNKFDGVEYHN